MVGMSVWVRQSKPRTSHAQSNKSEETVRKIVQLSVYKNLSTLKVEHISPFCGLSQKILAGNGAVPVIQRADERLKKAPQKPVRGFQWPAV
jgi:hypothetical protein